MNILRRWLLEAKWFWQRGRRGWADCDTWSFDWYLAGVIAGGLEHLRTRTHGYPYAMTPEEWDMKLTEIQQAFQHYHDKVFDLPFDYEGAVKDMKPIFDHWGNLWD